MIFVPILSDSRGDPERPSGEVGTVGTGYPVGNDLILTARHVLEPENRDPEKPILVRWEHPKECDWMKLSEESIEWRSPDTLDAALIRCTRPANVYSQSGLLSNDMPMQDTRWSSQGFPKASELNSVRPSRSFGGKVHSMAHRAFKFEIEEDSPPQKIEDWKGVSGMPVVVNGMICGVVNTAQPNYADNKRLEATPTWRLLEDPEFRNKIGYDEQRERVEKVKGKLVELLARSALAMETLVKQLGCAPSVTGFGSQKLADYLADSLFGQDIHLVIENLARTHQELRKIDGEDSAKAAESVSQAAQLIVPAICQPGHVASVKFGQSMELVCLPVCTKTLAEIVMAGVDGRQGQFHDREDENDFPGGKMCLGWKPEGGWQVEGEDVGLSQQEYLERKFDPSKHTEIIQSVDDCLQRQFPRRGVFQGRTAEERRRLTANLLAQNARYNRITYYVVFPVPPERTRKDQLDAVVTTLKACYPSITFLGLDGSADQEEQEQSLLYFFCQMLPLKKQTHS